MIRSERFATPFLSSAEKTQKHHSWQQHRLPRTCSVQISPFCPHCNLNPARLSYFILIGYVATWANKKPEQIASLSFIIIQKQENKNKKWNIRYIPKLLFMIATNHFILTPYYSETRKMSILNKSFTLNVISITRCLPKIHQHSIKDVNNDTSMT